MITVYLSHYEPCPLNQKYKTEHQLGLSLLSRGLSELYHLSVRPDELPGQLKNLPGGKPYLARHPEIGFNISHCDMLVGCAFSSSAIGFDIERTGPFNPHILRKVLTAEEKDFLDQYRADSVQYEAYFYRLWTLKESCIKQSGLGFSAPLTAFSFCIDCSKNPPDITCSQPGLYFYQQLFEQKYVFSICTETPVKPADVKLILL